MERVLFKGRKLSMNLLEQQGKARSFFVTVGEFPIDVRPVKLVAHQDISQVLGEILP
jgi:hypothetical protein